MIFGNEVGHAHIWLIPTFAGESSKCVVEAMMKLDKPKLMDDEARELVAKLKMR